MTAGGSLFFVDTNVLLYRLDTADTRKQLAAHRWLELLWQRGNGRLSWQVLNEYYAAGRRKIGASPTVLRGSIEMYSVWAPLDFSLSLIQLAWKWMDRSSVGYWDGLIVASAETLACRFLLSEDFQPGQKFGSVTVVNPFRSDPEEFTA